MATAINMSTGTPMEQQDTALYDDVDNKVRDVRQLGRVRLNVTNLRQMVIIN